MKERAIGRDLSINPKLRQIQRRLGSDQVSEIPRLRTIQIQRPGGSSKAAIHIPAQIPHQANLHCGICTRQVQVDGRRLAWA